MRASRGACGALLFAALLGGCAEDIASGGGRPDIRALIARGDMKSPRAASVSLASIEGAPDTVVARFEQAMTAEAKGRDMTLTTDAGAARYFVRGYLDAYPTEGGMAVHYVWDIYDTTKRRTRRLDDALTVKGAAGDPSADPWGVVDDPVLTNLAARSADDIAVFLSETPEAGGATAAIAEAPPAALR